MFKYCDYNLVCVEAKETQKYHYTQWINNNQFVWNLDAAKFFNIVFFILSRSELWIVKATMENQETGSMALAMS